MEKKRVLILTHKLGGNYGGIMQAYALQVYLRQFNTEPITTHFHALASPFRQFLRYGKYALRRIVHNFNPSVSDLPPDIYELLGRRTQRFIDQHIQHIDSRRLSPTAISAQYDALITGSDQVWRCIYVPVDKYLFDFVDGQNIRRLSYAASFGKDDLSEYSPELLAKSKQLAQQLDAISVREDSGIGLVKKHWGMEAECHVDPTLLLEKDHYAELVHKDSENLIDYEGNLFAYVLDRGNGKGEIIDKVAKELKLQDFEILPPKAKDRGEFFSNPDKYQLPPVTQWLKGFMDAEFVVTDSFHGTAFSIIFNKPFIAVGNKERGLARFSSLLKIFKLEDRLVSDASEVSESLIKRNIDWEKVNAILNNEKARSRDYLVSNLGLVVDKD